MKEKEKKRRGKKANQIAEVTDDIDCIVWFDGEKWRACLDLTMSGALEGAPVLTNFRDEHQYAFIKSEMSYCVTILENGNLLEILSPYSSHGTFVSHVAAGHFPEQPNLDGLAAGAQIVSMQIASSRNRHHTEKAVCFFKLFIRDRILFLVTKMH